ncbi:MAG TPA: sulfotransferase [Actinomycetota bacterium]|nr:sulfotransferase [Actinomycetota bacterium]
MTDQDVSSGPRFAFVTGTGRCGSSLIQEVLARHPDVGFLSNVDDLVPLRGMAGSRNNSVYRHIPAAFTQKGRVRYAPSEGYRALEREVSPLVVAPYRDLTAADVTPWLETRFRDFFAGRAASQGKPVFLHKFTGWPRTGFIQEIFPEARFIHVVRDGRAVANSFLQTSWWQGFAGPPAWGWGPLPAGYAEEWEESGRSFVLLAGLHWKMLEDAARESASAVDPARWMQVRYEDFVGDPRGRLSEMLDVLGLSWDPTFEAQLEKQTFGRGRTHAYMKDLTPSQVKLLDASLGDHLKRLGY